MGEGWSDFFATAINLATTTNRNTFRTIGSWVQNNPRGIRNVPYTSNTVANPLTYESVNNVVEVHNLGTVWATILHEILWDMIDVYGANYGRQPRLFKNAMGQIIPSDGRYFALKVVMDGMALQPCNPSFVDARNSILDADRVLTGGGNLCLMWKAFARRGLGFTATEQATSIGVDAEPVNRVNSFEIPPSCN